MKRESHEELLGSKRGVARLLCDPTFKKRINKLFRKVCRNQRKLQINQVSINLYIINNKVDEIGQMVLESNNYNQKMP